MKMIIAGNRNDLDNHIAANVAVFDEEEGDDNNEDDEHVGDSDEDD